MISRRVALWGLLAPGLLPPCVVASVLAPTLADAQSAEPSAGDPARPVAKLNDALLAVMHAGTSTPFPQRFAKLAPVIDQTFDLSAILRTSVGLKWDQLPPDQQSALLQVFEQFTVASYAANFQSFDGQRFEILPDRRTVGTEQVVETKLVQKHDDTRIDYVMQSTGGTWKAVDVLLDGSISRVAVQRSDFRSLLASGNADALIRSLQNKVAQLSGGTLS
jgi:phospholipid transport system substrate-binding protein